MVQGVCFHFFFFSCLLNNNFSHLEDKPDVVGLFPVSYVQIQPDYVPKSLQKALNAALGTKEKKKEPHHHKEKESSKEHKEKDSPKEHKEKASDSSKEHSRDSASSSKESKKSASSDKSSSKSTERRGSDDKDLAKSSPSSKSSSSKKEKKPAADDSAATNKSLSAAKLETRNSRSSTIGGDVAAPPLPPLHTIERAPPAVPDEKSPHHHRHPSSSSTTTTATTTSSSASPSSSSSKAAASAKKKSSSKTSGLTAGGATASERSSEDASSGANANTPRHLTVDNFDSAMDYERRVRGKEVRNDALASELLLYPPNDVRVVTMPRPLRQCHGSGAAVPSLPADAEPHLKLALSTSVRDFVAVHHKSREQLAKQAPTPPVTVDKSEKEKLLRSPLQDAGGGKKLATTLPKEADREYGESENARLVASLQQHRRRVLDLYHRADRSDQLLHARAPAALPEAPRASTQLRVTMLNLKLNVDVGEAFFLAVALYDLRARQKLSETWHVDLNSDEVLLQFEERKRGRMHAETRARSALFGVASEFARDRLRDLVLVVRIERVACPDEAAGVDLYCRGELKPKDAEKARAAADGARAMLGNVLQPFAWTYARPFVDESGAVAAADDAELRTPRSVLVFDRLFKVKADRVRDDVLYDEIRKRDESADKSALIPGTLECATAVVQGGAVQQIGGRLDTSLRVLQPTPDDDVKLIAKHKLPRTPLVRELCAFVAAPGPQLEYTNHVHVHCEWLDLHNDAATVNARNIACSIALCLDDRVPGAPGAEMVYGGASLPRLVAELSSPLTYRTRRPQYYFEAKVELPVRVPRGAHLLFTMRHTACRLKTGGLFSLEAKEDATSVLGYACLPLLAVDAPDDEPRADVDDGDVAGGDAKRERRARDDISPLQVLADGEHLLSVARTLPANYLDAYVDESPAIAWCDKKPVFQCRTRLCSSVHTNNGPLALFYASAKEHASADEMRAAQRHLAAVDVALLSTQFVGVIDQLVAAIAHSRGGGAKWAFSALIETVLRVDQRTRPSGKTASRNAMLDAYLYYLSLGGDAVQLVQKLLDTYVDAWIKCLDDAETRVADWHNALWFLLGLVAKVVAVACAHRNALDDSSVRSTRISEGNAGALRALVERLTAEMLTVLLRSPGALVTLNRTLALFFSDLFALLDRGFVFDLLLVYTRRLRAGAASPQTPPQTRALLGKLRIELHGHLATYEHYVPLNLPLPFAFRGASSMRADWWRRHFLVGLLIDECALALAGDDRLVKHAAASTLRTVLMAQARAQRSAEAQRRVVDMFFPLLQMLSDHALHVTGDEDEDDDEDEDEDGDDDESSATGDKSERASSSSSSARNRKQSMRKLQSVRTMRSPPAVSSKPFDLFGVLRKKTQQNVLTTTASGGSGSGVSSAHAPAPASAEAKRAEEVAQALIDAERRDWLACVLHIVSECSRELLVLWVRSERSAPLGAFCSLLVAAVRRFAADGCADLLAREACVCAQSVVALLFAEVPRELASNDNLRLDAFHIIVQLLVAAPPVDVLLNTFTLVRRFLHEQTKAVFVGKDSTYAASLCFHVLRYCGSPNDDVRSHAAALWLRLASTNMRAAGNFSRVKLQSTIAISSLAGALDSNATKSALEAAVRHVTTDDGKRSWALNSHTSLRSNKASGGGSGGSGGGGGSSDDDEGEFDKQLSALTQRLFGVIKNSILMNENKDDPEMEADLLHRLSLNYVESPVLRVTWLGNLASKHVARHRWTEAACCYVLIAMLSSAYLRKREGAHAAADKAGVPLDDAVFRGICAHLKLEPGLPELEQPNIYDSPSFSRDGLHTALNSAVGCLLKADLYELAVKVYGVLVALHIAHDDYGRLARVALQLPAHCEKLVKLRDNESRIFAHYYCVSFHGAPWNEFSSRQYIYKASPEHRVAEFTELMRLRFEQRFGAANVRVLAANESADAIKSKCAAEKSVAFVQIAAVRPHASSNTKRKTEFDMNHNVGRFALEQPFVPGGGAYGQTAKQWKRRLVYKCTSTFPHLSPRLVVVDVDERQLSPLACAIETIAGRADQLLEEVQAPVPDVKQLQLLLQGSVLLQVNAGPLEIANVFLRADFVAAKDDLAPGEKSDALQAKLRTEFRRFITAAADAVKLNGTLVGADQAEFQNELEKGLERTRAELEKFQID